jgi:hypothetical protein
MLFAAPLAAQATDGGSKVYVSTSKGCYMANGKPMPTYFWSARTDFGDTFSSNPMAQAEYEKYKKLITWFPYLNWGALGLAIGYEVVSLNNDNFNAGAFWIIFAVPWISGLIVAGNAHRHLTRAMNLYNGVEPDMASRAWRDLPSLEVSSNRGALAAPISVGLLHFDF